MKKYFEAVVDFLVPEQRVSVKMLFDNVRNGLMGATFATGGAWLRAHPEMLGGNEDVAWLWQLFMLVAMALILMNAMQIYAIYLRVNRSLRLSFSGAKPDAPAWLRLLAGLGIAVMLAAVQLGISAAFLLALIRGTHATAV